MTPRQQRIWVVVAILAGVGLAVALAIRAFQGNLLYFFSPSQVQAGSAPVTQNIRIGGLVVAGSIARQPGSLEVEFDVTDNQSTLRVRYDKVLPDLFREGQGVVALGRLGADGVFAAEEVLAKHDENYMPPEVAEALKTAHEGGSMRSSETQP